MARLRKVRKTGGQSSPSNSVVGRPLHHFFKIIPDSTIQPKRLRIPKMFVRNFGDELPDIARLIVPNGCGCIWLVGLTKAENNTWFDDGWHEFLVYHSIHYGYSLVFRYWGNSNLHVFIFDKTACEIQYPTHSQISKEPNCVGKQCSMHQKDDIKDRDPVEILGSSQRYTFSSHHNLGKASFRSNLENKKCCGSAVYWGSPNSNGYELKSKKGKLEMLEVIELDNLNESSCGELSKSKTKFDEDKSLAKYEEDVEVVNTKFSRSCAMASYGSKLAICAARMLKPKSPSCIVVLNPYHVKRSVLVYSTRGLSGTKVACSSHLESIWWCDFGKGWPVFAREFNLEEGDFCVFELINSRNGALKVSIIPASSY